MNLPLERSRIETQTVAGCFEAMQKSISYIKYQTLKNSPLTKSKKLKISFKNQQYVERDGDILQNKTF